MKNKFLLTFLLSGAAAPVIAQETEKELSGTDIMNYVGYGAILFSMLLFIIAMLAVLRAVKAIARVLVGAEALKEQAEKTVKATKPQNSTINKLLSLKPLSEEKDLIMQHEFDGIQELDNPTPGWFMSLFYTTIVFAVCYLLIYHVFGVGQLQDAEYKTEMAVANKEKEAFLAKSANNIDESSVKLSTDASVIDAGKAIFTASCSPCHGAAGQGVVGPNLTDDFWLHGGSVNSVFKTIKYGVTDKGMPNWDKQLSPKQIASVANYIKSIHGTNPPNAKAPQGEKEADDTAKEKETASL
ncbi:cbb3-type cytochrome c oxidase N-terminal domain-containing protein [Mucilaginibacter calamicampi]|uniref:Cbb3-type cytochrome c oxidase N-terminal domain-containing protein n=1 Tax=Mucilaginibacter calamicampi TaxID=1302352 RepID=A0ABW2Z0N8_9SPHI